MNNLLRYSLMFGSLVLFLWFLFNNYVNRKSAQAVYFKHELPRSYFDDLKSLYIPFIKTSTPKNFGASRPGSIFHTLGKLELNKYKKKEYFERALMDYPWDEELIYDHSINLIKLNMQIDEALSNFNFLLRSQPDLISANVWKAIALLKLEKSEEVLDILRDKPDVHKAYGFLTNYFCLSILLSDDSINKMNLSPVIKSEVKEIANDLQLNMAVIDSLVFEIVDKRESLVGYSWKALSDEELKKLIYDYRTIISYSITMKKMKKLVLPRYLSCP